VTSLCEHGNEPSGYIQKWGYFLTVCVSVSFSNLIPHHGVNSIYSCTLMKVVLPFMVLRSWEII
jgi:hypothetical protein